MDLTAAGAFYRQHVLALRAYTVISRFTEIHVMAYRTADSVAPGLGWVELGFSHLVLIMIRSAATSTGV